MSYTDVQILRYYLVIRQQISEMGIFSSTSGYVLLFLIKVSVFLL